MPLCPFREFLRSLPGDIELARDAGLPVILDVDRPLPVHAQRLMDTLGVEVRVSSQSVRGRGMGAYTEDGAGRQPFEANLIDFRHSVVQAHKRADAGDESLEICPHCMCEVDVDPQPHRPGCAGIGGARATSSPVLAGFDPVQRPPAPKPAVVAGAAFRDRGADALARMDDGLPQEPELDDEPDDVDDEPVLEEREPQAATAASAPTAIEPPAAPSRSSSTEAWTGGTDRGRWTRQAIVDAIRTWAIDHDGRPPTRRDWMTTAADHPNAYVVATTFASWADAIEAAGYGRPTRGTRRRDSSSEGAATASSARGHARPVDERGLDDEQPAMRAPTPAATADGSGEPEPGPAPDPVTARALAEPEPERLGPDEPGSAGARDALPGGLTLEQLVAAGSAMEAIASRLQHLDRTDRRAVWEFIGPLIELALA